MHDQTGTGPLRRNFHGRRRGKALRPTQKALLRNDLGALVPRGVSLAENPARTFIDPATIFGDARPLWLEIGFGGGEHMVHQARLNPGVGIIGCEPYINGVAMLLARIAEAGVGNLSVYPGDVRDLFDVLSDACIARAFLLYPDPWPKLRHHKRRFVTPGHLAPLARVMQPGAEFRIATDIPDYVRQALEEVPQAGFARQDRDLHASWPDWTRTRYEAKALREGRPPHYLTFHRAPAADAPH